MIAPTVPALVLQVLRSNPQAALALLPAEARQAYTALTQLPAMRADLNRQWDEYNTAIETTNTQAWTPAERAAWNERVRRKGVHLQAAETQFARLRAIYDQAVSVARGAGITIPPPQALGLGAPPLIVGAAAASILVIAAAIGASAIIVARGIIATELERAEQIKLGNTPPPSDLHTTARFGLGVVGAVALLGLLYMLRRSA